MLFLTKLLARAFRQVRKHIIVVETIYKAVPTMSVQSTVYHTYTRISAVCEGYRTSEIIYGTYIFQHTASTIFSTLSRKYGIADRSGYCNLLV